VPAVMVSVAGLTVTLLMMWMNVVWVSVFVNAAAVMVAVPVVKPGVKVVVA